MLQRRLPAMSLNKANPMICNPRELSVLLSGGSTASPSPTSTLDYRIHSPRGLRNNCDATVGVGLAIVAALEKPVGRSFSRSDPIPVRSHVVCNDDMMHGLETESFEENYTYVTSHRFDVNVTKVYYDAGDYSARPCGAVTLSPKTVNDGYGFPSGFLDSCHLCHSELHGRDIFMYRGEKAFCSEECRERQIMVDEKKELKRSGIRVSRPVDIANSPCSSSTTTSPVFSTGVVAM